MKTLRMLAALAVISIPFTTAGAADTVASTPRTDAECAALLEQWATDPKAAPKRDIDACRDQLAAATAAPAIEPEPAPDPVPLAALDPCSGPNAADNVLCWGPWASVMPAAEGVRTTLEVPDAGIYCDPGSQLSDDCFAQLGPQLAIEGCPPGTPCGFATIVDGATSNGEAEGTEFGRIELAPDGTSFVIRPASGTAPIGSVPMTTTVTPRPDGDGNLRSVGSDGDLNSRLIARVVQDDEGAIQLASDVWTHGTRENARSGYFAWGTTTSQAGLDALNAGNVSLDFSGVMSVNNATSGNMTVNLGTNPDWTGSWANPAWTFSAGGAVTGANLMSDPSRFSSNVDTTAGGPAGSFVQGALVGEAGGPRGITHIVDVTLEGQGRIKDVGLLREVIAAPVVGP